MAVPDMQLDANPGQQLSALDGDFLHLERRGHPQHFAIVLELAPAGSPLSLAELRSRVRQRADGITQFRTCIEHGVWRRPVLTSAVGWDPGDNVSEQVCGDESETMAMFGLLLAAPLSRRRPLWHVTLVSQRDLARQYLVLRVHHALADGMAAIGYAALLMDGAMAEFESFTRFLDSERFVLGPLDPKEKWRALRSFGSSWLAGRTRPRWPGLSNSGRRDVALVAVPTTRLYARMREQSATTRELVLAAAGTAMHRHPPAGIRFPRTIRVSLPCTLDPTFRHVGNGTSITVVNLDGECGDLMGQLDSLRGQLNRAERDRPELALPLLSAPSLVPWPVQRVATNAVMKLLRLDVEIGVNPAATRLREVLGHRIARVYPVSSLLGTSLVVAGLVFGDTTTFGVVCDKGLLAGYAPVFAKAFRSALVGESVGSARCSTTGPAGKQ